MMGKMIVGMCLIVLLPAMVLAGADHDHGSEHRKPTPVKQSTTAKHSKDKTIDNDHHDEEPVVTLSSQSRIANNIEIGTIQPETIEQKLPVFGKIIPVRHKQVKIYPRFAGLVKSLPYQVGDKVNKGAVLATIESNESLQNYTIKAPFSGILIKQNVSLGKFVKPDMQLYDLADLSSVWVELSIYRRDANRVLKGATVYVTLERKDTRPIKTTIDYISPIGNEHTQSIIARATLANDAHQWSPGLYVDAKIVVAKKQVPMAVKVGAIQTFDGKKVIFIEKKKDTFEAMAVRLGLSNQYFVQVLAGVKPGMRYVAKNSFILKAELEKSSAEHSH